MLTGVVVLIFPGDAAQVAVTIVISFVFLLISEVVRPYKTVLETWLYRAGHAVLFFSFFAALLYKVDIANERDASQEAFGIVVVLVHVLLIIAALCHALVFWIGSNEEDPFPRCVTSFRIQSSARLCVQDEEKVATPSSPVVDSTLHNLDFPTHFRSGGIRIQVQSPHESRRNT